MAIANRVLHYPSQDVVVGTFSYRVFGTLVDEDGKFLTGSFSGDVFRVESDPSGSVADEDITSDVTVTEVDATNMPGLYQVEWDADAKWTVAGGGAIDVVPDDGGFSVSGVNQTFATSATAYDTITRASGDWTTDVSVGDFVTVTGSAANDGKFGPVVAVSATVLSFQGSAFQGAAGAEGGVTVVGNRAIRTRLPINARHWKKGD